MKKVPLFLSLLLAGSILGCANNKAPAGHKHSYEYVAEVPAGCETTGVEAHYKCTGCDEIFILDDNNAYVVTTLEELTIAALGHDKHSVAAVDPTCVEDGNIAHEHCDRCGKLFIDEQEVSEDDVKVAALGHQLVDIPAVAADCVNGGHIAYQECERCHKLYLNGAEIQIEQTATGALGHQLVDVEEVDSTCSNTGVLAHKECSRCHKLFVDDEEVTLDSLTIPVAAHKHLVGPNNKCTLCNHTVANVFDNPDVRAWDTYNLPVTDGAIEFNITNLTSACGSGTTNLTFTIKNVRHDQVMRVTRSNGTDVEVLKLLTDYIGSSTTSGEKAIHFSLYTLDYQYSYWVYTDIGTSSGTPTIQFSLGHMSHNTSNFGACTRPYCEYTTAFRATLGENISDMNNRVIGGKGVADIVYTGLNDGESHTYRLVFVTSEPTSSFKLDCGYMKVSNGTIEIPQGNANPYDAGDGTYTRDIVLGDMIHGYFRFYNNTSSIVTITSAKVIVYH